VYQLKHTCDVVPRCYQLMVLDKVFKNHQSQFGNGTCA
jgi:hypothetical protein